MKEGKGYRPDETSQAQGLATSLWFVALRTCTTYAHSLEKGDGDLFSSDEAKTYVSESLQLSFQQQLPASVPPALCGNCSQPLHVRGIR